MTHVTKPEDMVHGLSYLLETSHNQHFIRVRDILHTNVSEFEEMLYKIEEALNYLDTIEQSDPDVVKAVEADKERLIHARSEMMRKYRHSLENAMEMVDKRIEKYSK